MTVVDAVVIALLLGAALSGWRRGLISSVASLIGALTGTVAAILLAPSLMARVDPAAAKIAIAMALVVVGIGAGEWAGSAVGRVLSERVTWRPARVVDRGLGIVGHTAAIAVVLWLVAVPLGSAPYPGLASAVRSSAVLHGIDRVMPNGVRDISDRMRRLIDDSGFPAILDPLAPTPDTAVPPPDPGVTTSRPVAAVAGSVLKIRGRADSCSRRIEGTGFVIGRDKMLTNAHVVAGTTSVTVEQRGSELPARVVDYDPRRDLAVLEVKGLTGRPLAFATAQPSGSPVVVAGYPLDGPYTLTAGRVRDRITLRGPDIYGSTTVTRDVLTLRAVVQPGNSGGPLLTPDGRVGGVVFGASVDRPDVGFALTAAEVAPVVTAGLRDSTPAATGACTSD